MNDMSFWCFRYVSVAQVQEIISLKNKSNKPQHECKISLSRREKMAENKNMKEYS